MLVETLLEILMVDFLVLMLIFGVSNSLISELSGAMLAIEFAHENGWRKFG